MLRYLLLAGGLALLLFVADLYVYRNWRRFARLRRWRLRWTLPLYRVLLVAMPVVLPAYLYVSRWWEVEPKGVRAVVIGLWLVYYLPRVPIVAVLVLKDAARGVSWLFAWFRAHLSPADDAPWDDGPGEPVPAAPRPDLMDLPRMSRAEFLRAAGWTAAAAPFVVVGHGVFRDLYALDVRRVDVPIDGLPRALDGLTIAQLSDLHAGSLFSARPWEEAVARVNAERPALVAITGDFVNHDAGELHVLLPALGALRSELGIVGCLGNHDHYAHVPDVTAALATTPLDLLVNTHRTFRVDGARLDVIGTDNTGFNQHYADLPRAVEGLPVGSEGARVLLAHDPTFWDGTVRPTHPNIDLQLSGHTHGGQVGFEFGPLRWSPARLVYARWAGLYAEPRADGGRQFLYVNRGLGTVGPPIRLGVRPEITLLTLRRTPERGARSA